MHFFWISHCIFKTKSNTAIMGETDVFIMYVFIKLNVHIITLIIRFSLCQVCFVHFVCLTALECCKVAHMGNHVFKEFPSGSHKAILVMTDLTNSQSVLEVLQFPY